MKKNNSVLKKTHKENSVTMINSFLTLDIMTMGRGEFLLTPVFTTVFQSKKHSPRLLIMGKN